MTNELIVPSLGESVSEATVSKWLKKVGESIKMDDPLVELETDKVTLEVNAPVNGILENIVAPEGTVVFVGKVLGSIGDSGSSEVQQSQPAPQPAFQPSMASFSVNHNGLMDSTVYFAWFSPCTWRPGSTGFSFSIVRAYGIPGSGSGWVTSASGGRSQN